MASELVSVVIPSHNYGRFVAAAVDSVLAQRYPHVEVIVVDDGSTDDTPQRLEPYRDRIVSIRQENQGVSAARNTGIRAARGELIALLDADDAWHPRKLELQMRSLAEHPEIGMLGADLFTDSRDCWPVIPDSPPSDLVPLTLDDLVLRTHFAPSSVVIRKSCLEAVGLFDAGLRCVEDRELWIRFAARWPVAKLPLPLLWYRLHPSSLSGKAVQMEEHELRVLRQAFAAVPALRGRPLFRCKALSYAAYTSAYVFGATHRWPAALRRVFRSLLLWPWPYSFEEGDGRHFARLRMAAVLVLRMLHLYPPDVGLTEAAVPPTAV
jgi:glycosyltransferase involved in cell wall biosynthesis